MDRVKFKKNKHVLQAKNPYSICLVWQLLSCVLGCDKTRDDSDIGLFIPPSELRSRQCRQRNTQVKELSSSFRGHHGGSSASIFTNREHVRLHDIHLLCGLLFF